jgi:ubiquinone/menaquinone biosynthesis C-methylase UbiE
MPNNLTKEELKDTIQWDVENWKYALSFWGKHYTVKPEAKVLALGEREGGLSLFFAKKGCQVVCSDHIDFPKQTLLMHKKYKVSENITYKKIDIKSIDFEDELFDVIVFKSVLGAIGNEEDQKQAIREIYRVLRPGGVFLFAENLKSTKIHQFLRNRFIPWSNHWRYIQIREMQQWMTDFKKNDYQAKGFFALFGSTEKQRNGLAYIDKVVCPIIPKNWRYILFGVGFK